MTDVPFVVTHVTPGVIHFHLMALLEAESSELRAVRPTNTVPIRLQLKSKSGYWPRLGPDSQIQTGLEHGVVTYTWTETWPHSWI